ncbi:PREDICTED: adrenocortical dysplasia protein homolog isoform X2 [Crocodylus porosus]|uniref:adrenocortical dysplasia protein homolog isoform X2 n=1 Tax=Crocodylus porosus TaxID=8502 RepID=UPI00093E2A52|nr:PREDICTED: adrenocortical dysplasia protein homolog isoform X2 [Crocodylus porosus]
MGDRVALRRLRHVASCRLEDKKLSVSKACVLQPWILKLLLKYEELEVSDNPVAGQVLKVLSDSAAADQDEECTAAVLHVSDGSFYIRVIITMEAVQNIESAQIQIRFSSLVGRILILQQYSVRFQEETKVEDCAFYVQVHRFIVLPMERQRVASLDCHQEPSILQKIKALWQRSIFQRFESCSEPTLTQLIDEIAQDRLQVLKQNIKDCLELLDPNELPTSGETKALPITTWEAERKRAKMSNDIFTVSASYLVICPEEEARMSSACPSGASQDIPESSSNDRDLDDQSIVAYPIVTEFGVTSPSLETSLDNPWNRLQSVSLTLTSSFEEKSINQPSPPKMQETELARFAEGGPDALPDSNTPDLEPESQKSHYSPLQDESAKIAIPLLLSSPRGTCPTESASQRSDVMFQATPDAAKNFCFSPASSIVGSSSSSSRADVFGSSANGTFKEQADSSCTVSPSSTEKNSTSPVCSSKHRRKFGKNGQDTKHSGVKRKLLVGAKEAHSKTHKRAQNKLACIDDPKARESSADRKGVGHRPRLEFVNAQRAKKTQMEEAVLVPEPPSSPWDMEETPEQENKWASAANEEESWPDQHKVQYQFKQEVPSQYKYKAPTPDLCNRLKSVRISKTMLKWACWILTEEELQS